MVLLAGLELLSSDRCQLGLEILDLDLVVAGINSGQQLTCGYLLPLADGDFDHWSRDTEGQGHSLRRLDTPRVGTGR